MRLLTSSPGQGVTANNIWMVVEDEPLVRMLVEDILEEAGLAVRSASSAEAAFDALSGIAARLSGLITDIHLESKLTGWDVAARARELSPDLPIVYMTGFSSESWSERGMPNSVLLEKPFRPVELLLVIEKLIHQR